MRATVIDFVPKPLKENFKSLDINGGLPRKKSLFARSTKRLSVNGVRRGETVLLIMHGWSKWVFGDESLIVIEKNKNVYIWRKDDEKYNAQLVSPPSQRHLSIMSIMIWGCVSIKGKGILTDVEGNTNAR